MLNPAGLGDHVKAWKTQGAHGEAVAQAIASRLMPVSESPDFRVETRGVRREKESGKWRAV